ncbi:MAG: ABC transporter ATP-binding protein [Myxococcales bacterium]|nr:ABC transporter ATP-binding protein [Myxococcales bacterium]
MIEVRQLVKRFGGSTVLRGIDLDVPEGAICGFIGPNGAGKTTTMRILATLDLPTSGSVRIGGLDVVRNAAGVRRRLGYMPDYYGSYAHLTVDEYLDFFARAHKIDPSVRSRRVRHIIDFTEVGPLLDRAVEALSKGEKQRLSLARALLGEPQLLILDEPAAGLDPRARVELRELLKVLAERGTTIFISSHILSELAGVVSWVIVIDGGRIRYAGPPEMAGRKANTATCIVAVSSDEQHARKFLLSQPCVVGLTGEGGRLVVELDEASQPLEDLVAGLVSAGVRVREFYQRAADLEEVFMSATSRNSDAPLS